MDYNKDKLSKFSDKPSFSHLKTNKLENNNNDEIFKKINFEKFDKEEINNITNNKHDGKSDKNKKYISNNKYDAYNDPGNY